MTERTPKKKKSTPKPSDPQSGAMKEVVKTRKVVPVADIRVLGKALKTARENGLALVVLCVACGEGLAASGMRPDGLPVMTCGCAKWDWGV